MPTSCSVILLFLQILLTNLSEVRAGKWYFDAFTGMENSPKCHIRRSWSHILSVYSMVCFQCEDKGHAAIIYYGKEAIGAFHTINCDYITIPTSVTLVSPQSKPGVNWHQQPSKELTHRVQFVFQGPPRQCIRLHYDYDWTKERFVPQEVPCGYARQWRSQTHRLYLNGWKLKTLISTPGVVKRTLATYKGMSEDGCKRVRSMKFVDGTRSMRCFECSNGFVAIVYYHKTPMAVTEVGTCRSPHLEYSFTVIPSPSIHEWGMQYLMTNDKCIMVGYTKNIEEFIEGEHKACQYLHGPTLSKTEVFLQSFGYRNGWKTVIEFQ